MESLSSDDSSFAQTVYELLLERPQTVACILLQRNGTLQWRIGCSEDLDLPWNQILPGLFPIIDAKGGGRGRSWQGVAGKSQGVRPFLDALKQAIWNRLTGGPNG